MARVTVINDRPEYLGVMREVLAELGHEAIAIPGEAVTLDQIAETQPDLLLVDLRMETGVLNDGWGIIVGSRAHPGLKDVPVIASSGDVTILRNRATEISALADVHPLEKPFSIEDVGELLDRLLERRGSGTPG